MEISVVFSNFPQAQHKVEPLEIVGEGKFYVYHARSSSLRSKNDFAMKVFPRKNGLPDSAYILEKRFLSKLSHPNIVEYFPILKHDFPYDLILTEYTPNGDLFDFISKNVNFDEKLVRTYFHQLIEGVEYLHGLGIAHLDLKLENLVLDNDFIMKIIDFDQAQHTEESQLKSGGTYGYRAPEVIKRRCKDFKKMDMYAIGVILYALLAIEMPFVEEHTEGVQKSARYETFRSQNDKFWREKENEVEGTFSKELRLLLNGLWEEDPKRRFGIEEVKRSRWYRGEVYSREELKLKVSKITGKNI